MSTPATILLAIALGYGLLFVGVFLHYSWREHGRTSFFVRLGGFIALGAAAIGAVA